MNRIELSMPWFGPKRIGYGLRPTAWQGWLVMLAAVAVILAVVMIASHA